MDNEGIVAVCEPFYPAFEHMFRRAWLNVEDAVSVLGIPTKVERANWMHSAIRSELRRFCDLMEPIVQFLEEPDGQGLDCMLIDAVQEHDLALRWGRYGDGHINRNRSHRQLGIQGQGHLPFAEPTDKETITATIGYTVEDDYTEGGHPAWWLGRLVLVRERTSGSEYIHDICVYSKPHNSAEYSVLADRGIAIRRRERLVTEQLAHRLLKKLG